jgi:general nucleoside transport system ATP-binding protein
VTPVLELRGISKRFGAVEALREVDFTLEPGEIHALLGENGAGKSTLMKAVFGLVRPDAGTIAVAGTPVHLRDPVDARGLGIGMVHQHFTSIPALSVLENVMLSAGWGLKRALARERLRVLSAETGLSLDPDARVERLSAGLKQRLEVLKALAANARILLLDEPSSVLSPSETGAFLTLVQGLRERGVSSVLITHKLAEALAVATRVTVLRRGAVVHSGPIAGLTPVLLAGFMLGEAGPPPEPRGSSVAGEVRARMDAVSVRGMGTSGSGLQQATFAARAGEIVGIAAIEGNGQREFLRALGGLAKPQSGQLEVARPVSFIPEDRSSEGLLGELSLAENLVLSQGRSAPWVTGPWVNWSVARARSQELIKAYGVRGADPGSAASALSGGNQQRLVIAAALERRPKVIVAENPTRGLDLRATAEVHERLRNAARQGVAVIVHLADLDELLELADRIAVITNGILVELSPGADRDLIGRRLLGGSAA